MTDQVAQGAANAGEGGVVTSAGDDHTVAVAPVAPKPTATDASTSTTMAMEEDGDGEPERCCWICYATDEDNRLAAWVKPCQCRGTTKWVHQSCLYRWIDEKLSNEESLRPVACPQCQTEYIIVYPRIGKMGVILEAVDTLITRLCPFLTAGIFVCSLYWTAVTFGAVTFLQIVGHESGMAIMQTGDPLFLLIGLPLIPIGLILGRMIHWDNAVLRLIHGRTMKVEKEQQEQQGFLNYPEPPLVSESTSGVRIFCGALLLPTISSIVGRVLFDSVDNSFQRTLLGGLTYVTVKGILKIYLRHRQYASRRNRRIVDYTEDNLRNHMQQTNNENHSDNGNDNDNIADGNIEAVGVQEHDPQPEGNEA
ncbi:hypothetical protein KR038_010733 [Drosophila bunnanda]|nr:hypothetical protein KR038_010733 [Drosophila bunnanda]